MKIIDENGSVVENPDLTAGYLAADTEAVEHPAQDAVEELSHYETVAEYPNGGKDVRKVIDRAAVPAAPAWTEQRPIRRYIRYTAEELARREKEQQEARQQQEALDKLPQTLAALQEDNKTLKKENEMLKQCLLEMSEIVYA